MTGAAISFLGGIYLSGGVPSSPFTLFIVILPMMAFQLYGARLGILAIFGFAGIALIQVCAIDLFGFELPYFDDESYKTSMAVSAIIGYSLILHIVAVEHKKADTLRKLLDAERKKLVEIASRDGLTQLCNVRSFNTKMEDAVQASSSGESEPFCVLFVDLNAFKPINDQFGHHAGDHVLQIISTRLTNTIRSVDTAARMGGDEFAILFAPGLTDQEVQAVIHRIRASIASPILFESNQLEVSASIGTVKCPTDGRTRETLMQIADMRMYNDKRANQSALKRHV